MIKTTLKIGAVLFSGVIMLVVGSMIFQIAEDYLNEEQAQYLFYKHFNQTTVINHLEEHPEYAQNLATVYQEVKSEADIDVWNNVNETKFVNIYKRFADKYITDELVNEIKLIDIDWIVDQYDNAIQYNK